MFNRNRGLRRVAAIVSISSLVTGCGILSSDSSEDEGPIVVGTTSAPSTLDPAASWDGSWELFRNIYQTLLSYPNGATAPEPDAAEQCAFTDSTNQVYRCELREGLTFSNGDALDAQAVKHSIDRIKDINVNGGPAGLLGSLDRVQAPSEREVVFHLNKPDATFPFVLATPAMSIVEPGGYPADALREDGKVVGSGPYTLESYEDGERAELVRNDRYQGLADRHNDAVTVRYFKDSAGMVKALRDGEIQVTLPRSRGRRRHHAAGQDQQGRGPPAGRGQRDGDPLPRLQPRGPVGGQEGSAPGRRPGDRPGRDRPQDLPGHRRPVVLDGPQGPDRPHHGLLRRLRRPQRPQGPRDPHRRGHHRARPAHPLVHQRPLRLETAQEFKEIERQLEASDLFTVTLESRPWKTYVEGYQKGEYPVFGRGWSPDFPDAENFIAPFVGKQNALGTPYLAPEITGELLPRSRRESDRANVEKGVRAGAADPRERRPAAAAVAGQAVRGRQHGHLGRGAEAMDPSTIMMMWQLYRKTSW